MSAVIALFQHSDEWSTMTSAYFYMGLSGSVIIIIQMILMTIGIGDSDTDMDVDGDLDGGFDDPSDGLAILSIRTLTAFTCLFGWTGFSIERSGSSSLLALCFALVAGSCAMFGVAWMMKWFHSLSVSGNVDTAQSMGKCGDVYLVIPANMEGAGVVNVKLGDATIEFKALTHSPESIPTGAKVLVLECRPDNTLIVERYND